MTQPASDFYEFGPFRLDASSRSLYRGDEFVPVPPKAFDTLAVLVADAGRVVSKETLLQRVWPDAFVEEGSIANNISVLRKLLNPHFEGDGPIATVARRGYRFTASVRLRNAQAPIALVAEAAPASEARAPAADRRRWFAWPSLVAAGAVVLVSAIGIAGAMRITRDTSVDRRPVRRAIAVLSMKNVSGSQDRAWLSTALAEGINGTLSAGGQIRVISGAAVVEMQQDLRPEPGIGLSRRELDQIGANLGCDLILTGNYLASSDGRVRVDLRLDDIKTGKPAATVSVVEEERRLPDLVAAVARELRSKLGLAPLLAGQTEAARAALSSNPNALRFYFLGLDALRVLDLGRATDMLTHAVEEDPDFALAHLNLALAWRVLGRDTESQAQAQRAFELSHNLSREDQLSIEGTFYDAMSDFPKAVETFQSLWTFYPDDVSYALKLFHSQLFAGRLADAGRVVDQMKALPPPADRDPRIALTEAEWLSRVGRLDEAVAAAGTAADRATLVKSTHLLAAAKMTQGRALQRLARSAEAAPLFEEAKKLYDAVADANGVSEALRAEAVVLMAQDSLDAAFEHADESLRIATDIHDQRAIVECWIVRSNALRRLRRLPESRADAESAVAASRQTGYKSALARALVALGQTERAERNAANARAHLEEAQRIGQEIGEPGVTKAAETALAGVGR